MNQLFTPSHLSVFPKNQVYIVSSRYWLSAHQRGHYSRLAHPTAYIAW